MYDNLESVSCYKISRYVCLQPGHIPQSFAFSYMQWPILNKPDAVDEVSEPCGDQTLV